MSINLKGFVKSIKDGVAFKEKTKGEALQIFRKTSGMPNYNPSGPTSFNDKNKKELNRTLKQVRDVRSGKETAKTVKANYMQDKTRKLLPMIKKETRVISAPKPLLKLKK